MERGLWSGAASDGGRCVQRAALRWARWLELVSGAAGWVHRAAVESMLGLHRQADKLWFVPSMQIHWPQAEITLRHGNRSLRFVLVRAEPQNAMTACALPDTQLLAVRERLCWKALLPQTCFVMPLWRPAGYRCTAGLGTAAPHAGFCVRYRTNLRRFPFYRAWH